MFTEKKEDFFSPSEVQKSFSGQLSPPTGLSLWKSLKNRNKNKNSKVVLSQVKLLSQNFRIGQISKLLVSFSSENRRRSSPLLIVRLQNVRKSTLLRIIVQLVE